MSIRSSVSFADSERQPYSDKLGQDSFVSGNDTFTWAGGPRAFRNMNRMASSGGHAAAEAHSMRGTGSAPVTWASVKRYSKYSRRMRVRALKHADRKVRRLEKRFQREKKRLEKKYNDLIQPVYKRRAAIVSGQIDPVEDMNRGREYDPHLFDGAVPGVPDFWMCVMNAHPLTRDAMMPTDIIALRYLEDVQCAPLVKAKGFRLKFHFTVNNPFFTNRTLTKSYFLSKRSPSLLLNSIGSEIHWKPNMNLTHRVVKKSHNTPGTETVITEEKDSFFNFFSPPQVRHYDLKTMDETELSRLEAVIDADYEVGCVFRDHLVPNAVEWYTGEAFVNPVLRRNIYRSDADLDGLLEWEVWNDYDSKYRLDTYEDLDERYGSGSFLDSLTPSLLQTKRSAYRTPQGGRGMFTRDISPVKMGALEPDSPDLLNQLKKDLSLETPGEKEQKETAKRDEEDAECRQQ